MTLQRNDLNKLINLNDFFEFRAEISQVHYFLILVLNWHFQMKNPSNRVKKGWKSKVNLSPKLKN